MDYNGTTPIHSKTLLYIKFVSSQQSLSACSTPVLVSACIRPTIPVTFNFMVLRQTIYLVDEQLSLVETRNGNDNPMSVVFPFCYPFHIILRSLLLSIIRRETERTSSIVTQGVLGTNIDLFIPYFYLLQSIDCTQYTN